MGCDIHLAVEGRREDGAWERVEPLGVDTDRYYTKKDGKWKAGPVRIYTRVRCEVPGGSRNYATFAVLADVRQRGIVPHGWYGVEELVKEAVLDDEQERVLVELRKDMYPPIAPPRGVPADATQETLEESDWTEIQEKGWRDAHTDWHSHSYFTLSELLAYDWNHHVRFEDSVPASIAERTKEIGASKAWREAYAEGRDLWNEDMVKVEWTCPVYAVTDEFYNETIPALKAYAEQYGGPDNVRLIFWFDN
jgi:hypothetical protein